LTGWRNTDQQDLALAYARTLLADLGVGAAITARRPPQHPALAWAESGAMALTGHREGPARICPIPLASAADGALLALEAITRRPLPDDFRGAHLLGERAAIAGYTRNGSISPGGGCRFLLADDGWLAINLAREEDWQLVPALIERDIPADWPALTEAIRSRRVASIVSQGRDIGLAVGHYEREEEAGAWHHVLHHGTGSHFRRDRPLVIDLSNERTQGGVAPMVKGRFPWVHCCSGPHRRRWGRVNR